VEEKRIKIQEWFDTPKPKFPIKALLFGAVLVLIGLVMATNNRAGSALFALLVGALIISIPMMGYSTAKKKYDSRASTDQMLSWLREDFEALKVASLNKLGLDPSELKGESIIVRGPLYALQSGLNADEIRKRRLIREDDINSPYLYACWTYMVIHFAGTVMGTYRCAYNWYRNAAVADQTEEFGYESVVSVKTETESTAYTLIDGALEHSLKFILSLTSGDKIEVRLSAPTLKSASEEEDKSLGERAVQRIRTLKRDRSAAPGR
jgi:hypothetical protein